MLRSLPTKLALLLWTLTIVAIVATVVDGLRRYGWAWFNVEYLGTALLFGLVVPATVGLVLSTRLPQNITGWIFQLAALMSAGEGLYDGQTRNPFTDEATVVTSPWLEWLFWAVNVLQNTVLLAILTLLLQLFPTGRPLSPRWRGLTWVTVALLIAIGVGTAFGAQELEVDAQLQNPVYIEFIGRISAVLSLQVLLLGLIAIVGSFASLVVRFRRARGVERLQLKWFVYMTSLLVGAAFIWALLPVVGLGHSAINDVIVFFAGFVGLLIGIPVVVAIAVLRYRLYEIDRIINRTLVYGALTLSLLLIYVAIVFLLGEAVQGITGESSQLVVAASTLAVAAIVQPLRTRIQGIVDRHFYRSRYDAARTLESFSTRLRDELDLNALSGELRAVVSDTMQPAHVSLWLRPAIREK